MLLALMLLLVCGCSTVEPTPTPRVVPSATSRPSASPTPSAEPTPSPERWRIDVVNGPRRVIVSVSPGGLYFVEPNVKLTLFEAPEARAGGIELIEVTDDGCVLLDTATFPAESFTIMLIGGPTGPYALALEPGTTLAGPPTAERTSDCMG